MTDLQGLSLREHRFVEAICADPDANATEAARIAGYSDTTNHHLEVAGSRLLSRVEVQSAIVERTRIAADHARITPELVLAGLLANAEAAYSDKAYGASTAAWRELGRYLQLFSDRLDVRLVADRAAELAAELGIDPAELEAQARKLLEAPKQ